jgi:hypothetical protein
MRKFKRVIYLCLRPFYNLLPQPLRTIIHSTIHRVIESLAAPTVRVSLARLQDHVEVLRGCMTETDRLLLSLLKSPAFQPGGLDRLAFPPLPVGDHRLLVPHPADSYLYLDTRDVTAAPRLLLDSGEHDVLSALEAVVRPGEVVVEANAREGFFTLAFARRVGLSGQVIAFEPNAVCRAVLDDNLTAHQRGGVVTVVPHAAWGAAGANGDAVRISEALARRGVRPDVIRLAPGAVTVAVVEDLAPCLGDRPEFRLLLALHPSPEARDVLDRLKGLGLHFWQVAGGDLREQPAEHLLAGPAQRRVDLVAARSASW